jgi:hypothetical protein
VSIYDQSHNERPRSALSEHIARPFKRAVDVVRNRVDDLTRLVNTPAFLDQYPAKAVPFRFSKLYGPIPLTAAQHRAPSETVGGFIALAPVANNAAFLNPRNGPLFVNREGAWYWTTTNVTGWYSLTYNADPGFGANTYVNPLPVSDIFNSVVDANGGALQMNNFYGHVNYEIRANLAWDIRLYDRKRARYLHDGILPPQVMTAQNFANKLQSEPCRFDPNTTIEPRLRILEVRPGSLLDTDDAFNAAQFAAYISITFGGYKVLDV